MIKLNKRILLNIAVISSAFLLFAFWYRNEMKVMVQTASSTIKFYKVYLITTDKEYQYWEILNQGASDMANAIGVQYIWDAPKKRDVDQQIQVITRAVESGADALLIAADDPKEVSGVVEDAKARGVKVIYVDSPAIEEAITALATDNYKAGVIAGETMLAKLQERQITSGSIGIVSIGEKVNTALREKGFRDALSKNPNFIVLDPINTNGDPDVAQLAAEQIIQNNSDLVGLYGTNEGTSIGVGNANKANDNRFVSIGYDKTDIMVQLVKDGSLQAIIVQNPYTMGYLGVSEAVAAILGKSTGPSFIDTGVSVLDKENIEQ